MSLRKTLTPIFVLAAAGTVANARAEGEVIVTVNRYAGLPNFDFSRQTRWLKTPEGYRKLEHPPISSSSNCGTTLEMQQLFPLDQMVATGYLTAENARKYQALGKRLDPQQVSFLELFRNEPLPRKAGNLLHPVERHLRALQEPRTDATMWVIAGQKIETKTRSFQHLPLPWQLEPELKEVSERLDRKKYPCIWEWGRAAQIKPRDIGELLGTAALLQLHEIAAIGCRLEDAWVSFHSLGEAHTIAYRRRYPDRIFHENPETHEAIFMVPLSEVVEQEKAWRHSPVLNELVSMGYPPEVAVSIVRWYRETELSELDWVVKDSRRMMGEKPLVVLDTSEFHDGLVASRIAGQGFPEEQAERMHSILNQLYPDDFIPNHPDEVDYVFTPGTARRTADRNAIYVTNIPPGAVQVDAEFIPKLVFSLLRKKKTELERALGGEVKFEEFRKFFVDNGIRIQIGTFAKETAEKAESFAAHERGTLRITGSTQVLNAMDLFQAIVQNGMRMPNQQRNAAIIEYEAKTLFDLLDSNPQYRQWFDSGIVQIDYGAHHGHRGLLNLNVF